MVSFRGVQNVSKCVGAFPGVSMGFRSFGEFYEATQALR